MHRFRRPVVALAAAALLALGTAAPAGAAAPSTFRIAGDPVRGAASVVDAPAVGQGVWRDTLGGVGTARQTLTYTVHRERTGATLHVSVVTPATAENDTISAVLLTAEGESCATDSDSVTGSNDASIVLGVSLSVPADTDERTGACAAAGDFVVRVSHGSGPTSTYGRRADVPIELRVREEPPVHGFDALPVRTVATSWRDPVLSGRDGRTTGSDALATARVLGAGSWTGSIRTGDSQVFAVPLDFGQSLAAAVRIAVPTGVQQRLQSGGWPTLSVRILSPSRTPVEGSPDADTDAADHARGSTLVTTTSDGKVVYQYSDPITYRNRYADDTAARASAERGRYLVVVSLIDRDGDSTPITVDYRLGLAVRGDVSGVPDYTADDGTSVDDGQQGAGGGVADVVRRLAGGAVIALGVLAAVGGAVLLVVTLRRRRPA